MSDQHWILREKDPFSTASVVSVSSTYDYFCRLSCDADPFLPPRVPRPTKPNFNRLCTTQQSLSEGSSSHLSSHKPREIQKHHSQLTSHRLPLALFTMNATMLPRCYNGISSSGDLNKITSSSFLSPRSTAAATILAASHPPSSSTFCPSEQERRMKLLLSAAIALTPNTDISRTCKRKRRVEFQLESNQVCHLLDANQHHSTTEDKEALWYSATSLSEFKREAKRLCQTVDIEDVIHTAYSLSNDPSADTTVRRKN